MKKKIFASITALFMIVSVFASVPAIVSADESSTEIGGLDFYSITLHYNQNVLVNYYETTIKVKNDSGKTVSQSVKYFYNVDAENEEGKYIGKKDIAMLSDKLVIPAGTKTEGNFYQLVTNDGAVKNGLHYSKIPYTNAFITHIVDASILRSNAKIDLYGITAPYDDAPYEHQNPNVQYGDDGYAVASEKDKDGNSLKIDVNGYLVGSDSIWKSTDDTRIELYTAIPVIRKTGETTGSKKTPVTEIVESESYEWVAFNDRLDSNGKIKNIKNMSYKYMVTKDEYDNFLADETRTTLPMYRAENDDAYSNAAAKGKYIGYGKPMKVDPEKDKTTYFNTDRVFTAEDILKDKSDRAIYGTPRIGTPVLTVSIKEMTIELDALGTQLYDDKSADPQQKNTLTVSINDCEQNANFYKTCYEENRYTEKQYKDMMTYVLGSAKSVTTRTEINTNKSDYKSNTEYGYSPTVQSVKVDVPEAVLSNLPSNATLYINFHIAEQQPAAAFDADYQKKFLALDSSKQSTLLSDQVNLKKDADKPDVITANTDNTTGFPTWAIIAIAAGAVVIIAAIVIVVVVNGKKKKTNGEQK